MAKQKNKKKKLGRKRGNQENHRKFIDIWNMETPVFRYTSMPLISYAWLKEI